MKIKKQCIVKKKNCKKMVGTGRGQCLALICKINESEGANKNIPILYCSFLSPFRKIFLKIELKLKRNLVHMHIQIQIISNHHFYSLLIDPSILHLIPVMGAIIIT